MKKIVFYLVLICTSTTCYGKTWTVTNSGFSFSPATLTIAIGDDVNFSLGSTHNAREVSLMTWNANGNTALPGFQTPFGGGPVPASQLVEGTHYYVCSAHASMGMKGKIIVQSCTPPSQPPAISGNSAVCANSSNTYSITSVDGATSYTWTLPSGWTGSSTTTSITITCNSTGGNVTVVANNTCGASLSRSLNIGVSSTPNQPGNITGSTSVCANSTNVFSINSVAGATSYTWSLPSGWTGNSSTASISANSNSSSGNITVMANNTCGVSVARTLNIGILSAPAQPSAITGNTSVCANSTNIYVISPVAGATSYTWTLPSGWTGSSSTTSLTTKANSTSGNISVTANNTCGGSSNRVLSIAVTNVPGQPVGITGSTSVCANSSNTFSIAPVAGASSYSWVLPAGWTGSSTTTSITTLANSTGGNISVTANNGCGASTARIMGIAITSIPNQPVSITGSTNICANTSNSYSIAAVNGATSYSWTLLSGWAGSSTTTSIIALSNSTGGKISVTANNGCGNSAAINLNVVVSGKPNQPINITGNASVCANSPNIYKIDTVPGATSYTWSLPSGWTGSSTNNFITTMSNSTGGIISVVANNGCGVSGLSTLSVSVLNVPAMPTDIAGATAVCANSTNTYSIDSVAGATSYTWSLPFGWIGISNTESITVMTDTVGGNISVKANNDCGSSEERILNVAINATPKSPEGIFGLTSVCSNSLNKYFINSVPGATSYTWTLPSGWTGHSNEDSIMVLMDSTGGTIMVTANNTCGSSANSTLNITVNGVPVSPVGIVGDTSVCSNSLHMYYINPVPGATSYSWTLSPGWTGNSSSDSIMVMADTSAGSIVVIANNSCGSSDSSLINIMINNPPLPPAGIEGNDFVCNYSFNAYYINPVPGASTYTWSFPSGWKGSSNTDSVTTFSDVTGGIIKVTANNSCGSSDTSSLNVNIAGIPIQPDSIYGPISISAFSTNVYYINPVPGASSYTWILPMGWTGNSIGDSITITSDTTGGLLQVTANNVCGISDPTTLSVSITCVPQQPQTITGSKNVCANTLNTYYIDSVPGSTFYVWTLPARWIGTSTTDSITVMTDTVGGIISVTANNDCGASEASLLNVHVTTIPDQPITIDGLLTVCANSLNIYHASQYDGAISYTWTLPDGWSGNSNTDTIVVMTDTIGGTMTVMATTLCGSTLPGMTSIGISNVPNQPSGIMGNATVCAKSINLFYVSPVDGALSYTWTLPDDWTGNSTGDSISLSGLRSGPIAVTANNTCGVSEPQSLNIQIDSVDVSVSQTGMFLIANADGASYQWIDCITKTPIPGQTDKNFVSEMNGSYAVIIMQNNCVDTSICYTFNTIGDEGDFATYDISIFPNPSHGFFTVATDKKGKGEIEICNFMGEVIRRTILDFPRIEINLDTYSPGIYFAHIYYDHKRLVTKKIILK